MLARRRSPGRRGARGGRRRARRRTAGGAPGRARRRGRGRPPRREAESTAQRPSAPIAVQQPAHALGVAQSGPSGWTDAHVDPVDRLEQGARRSCGAPTPSAARGQVCTASRASGRGEGLECRDHGCGQLRHGDLLRGLDAPSSHARADGRGPRVAVAVAEGGPRPPRMRGGDRGLAGWPGRPPPPRRRPSASSSTSTGRSPARSPAASRCPQITRDLVALAAAGIPVVFNTGRSDAFIRDEVVGPLIAAGLPAGGAGARRLREGRVVVLDRARARPRRHERGAGRLDALAMPADFAAEMERARHATSSPTWSSSTTPSAPWCRSSSSTTVESATYLARQREFDEQAMEALVRRGLGVRRLDDVRPRRARRGAVARRPHDHLDRRRVGPPRQGPRRRARPRAARRRTASCPSPGAPSATRAATTPWPTGCTRTATRSRTSTSVRPTACRPPPYPVLTSATGLIHDEAGAEFLARWAARRRRPEPGTAPPRRSVARTPAPGTSVTPGGGRWPFRAPAGARRVSRPR